MNKNLKAILALLIGISSSAANAEYLELNSAKVEDLASKHGIDFLNELSERGLLFIGSNQNSLYLRMQKTKELLLELQKNGDLSGEELVKDLTKGATIVSRKKFEGMSLGTQDVIKD